MDSLEEQHEAREWKMVLQHWASEFKRKWGVQSSVSQRVGKQVRVSSSECKVAQPNGQVSEFQREAACGNTTRWQSTCPLSELLPKELGLGLGLGLSVRSALVPSWLKATKLSVPLSHITQQSLDWWNLPAFAAVWTVAELVVFADHWWFGLEIMWEDTTVTFATCTVHEVPTIHLIFFLRLH